MCGDGIGGAQEPAVRVECGGGGAVAVARPVHAGAPGGVRGGAVGGVGARRRVREGRQVVPARRQDHVVHAGGVGVRERELPVGRGRGERRDERDVPGGGEGRGGGGCVPGAQGGHVRDRRAPGR